MKLHVGDAGFGEERKPLEDGEVRTSRASEGIAAGAKIPNASTNFPDSGFSRQGGLHERILFGFYERKSWICDSSEIEMQLCFSV
jgi:hypothetical protein